MTEAQFWKFMQNSWERNGRILQASGVIDRQDLKMQVIGEYYQGHCLLPQGYDKISEQKINEMGKLLLDKSVSYKTKEAIMLILAHHGSKDALTILKEYSKTPDRGLEIFTELALDECKMWNG